MGIRFGIDVGQARIGVARTDPAGIMAVPVATVAAGDDAVAHIAQLVTEYDAAIVYVGLPLSLSGSHTTSTHHAITFAEQLNELTECDVYLVDERLSTVTATSAMRDSGRTSRTSRDVIDQAAAIVILEHALAVEKQMHSPAGIRVGEHASE